MKLKELRLARMLPAVAAVLSLAFGTQALAAKKADAGPLATVRAFLNAFNKGDIPGAEATHAADVSIIDEVAPYSWRGPGAFQAWAADLGKHDKAAGFTGEKVTLSKADVVSVSGDDAYVVSAVTYTYKVHGKPTVEPAHMAMALHRTDGAWKITGWAWAGTAPHAVAPKPAAAGPTTPPAPAKP